MSDIKDIVENLVLIRSHMMIHEGGAKFYQVLTLEGQPSDAYNSLVLTRYGKISAIHSGGVLDKGKEIRSSSNGNVNAYANAIIRNKRSGGYRDDTIPSSTGNWYKKLVDYKVIQSIPTDIAIREFFSQFSATGNLSGLPLDDLLKAKSTDRLFEPKPAIVRSAEFGSWS